MEVAPFFEANFFGKQISSLPAELFTQNKLVFQQLFQELFYEMSMERCPLKKYSNKLPSKSLRIKLFSMARVIYKHYLHRIIHSLSG